jgi:hypothetical protein
MIECIYLICKDSYADTIDSSWFATNEDDIKNIIILENNQYGDTVIEDSFCFNWENDLVVFRYYPFHSPEDIQSNTWYIRKFKSIKIND